MSSLENWLLFYNCLKPTQVRDLSADSVYTTNQRKL